MVKKMFKWKKRLPALLLAGCLLVSLGGCGSSEVTSDPAEAASDASESAESAAGAESTASEDDEEVVFTIGYGYEPSTLDPRDFNSTACTLIGYDCYDTLLNFSMEGSDLEPCLAESWEQIDDTTYVYKIREDVKFCDGNAMTMEDVLYSMERVTEETYSMSYLFENVDHFEINEETWELTVYLTQADATWKYVPATSACIVVEKAVVEAEGDKYGTLEGSCVGTGPYMLESWESGTQIVTVKNPYYWGDPDTLDVDKVVMMIVEDDTSLALAAQSGQIDYARSLPTSTLSIYESIEDMTVYSYDGTSAYFLAFNCQTEPFNDVNARRAVAYCIDKDVYTSLIGGTYATSQGAFILPRSMFYLDEDAWNDANDTLESYQQDFEKAAEALAASSYPDGFEFDFYCTSTNKTGAEAIQSMIVESGLPITMNIIEISNADVYSIQYGYTTDEDGYRVYDMYSTGWISDWLDPTGYMKNCLDGGSVYAGGANKAAWINDEFDALLDQSYLETDDSIRSELMLEAMEVAVEDCPYVTLYEIQDTYVLSNEFEYEEGANFFWNFTVANVHVKDS